MVCRKWHDLTKIPKYGHLSLDTQKKKIFSLFLILLSKAKNSTSEETINIFRSWYFTKIWVNMAQEAQICQFGPRLPENCFFFIFSYSYVIRRKFSLLESRQKLIFHWNTTKKRDFGNLSQKPPKIKNFWLFRWHLKESDCSGDI